MVRDGGVDRFGVGTIARGVVEGLNGAPLINDRWTRFDVSSAGGVTEQALIGCARRALGRGEQEGQLETIHWQIYDRNRPPSEFTPEVVLDAVKQGTLVVADVTSPGDSDPQPEVVLVVPNGDNGANMLVFMGDGRQTPGTQVIGYLEQNMIGQAIGYDRLRAEADERIGKKRRKMVGWREESAEKLVRKQLGELHDRCKSPEELLRVIVETIRGSSLTETSLVAKAKERLAAPVVEVGPLRPLVLEKVMTPQVEGVAPVDRKEVIKKEPAVNDVLVAEAEAKGMDLDLARMMVEVYGGRSAVENALTHADEETIFRCNEMWREQTNPSFIRTMMAGLDWRTELTANAILASVASVSGVVLSPVLVNAGLLEFSLNPHPAIMGLVGGFLLAEASMVIMAAFRLVNGLSDYDRRLVDKKHRVLGKIVDLLVAGNGRGVNLADNASEGIDLADREDSGSLGSSQSRRRQMVMGR